jgi:plastocyanin
MDARTATRTSWSVTGLAVTALLAAGCGTPAVAALPTPTVDVAPTPTDGPPVATSVVAIQNYTFGPKAVTVPVGTAVTWTNDDLAEHTVTAKNKSFDSSTVENTKSFTFTFSQAGTFSYFCAIHPYMTGTVIVTAK